MELRRENNQSRTYLEDGCYVPDHHVHVLDFSVLFKNRRTFKSDDVIVSSDTEHINRVREQATGSGITELLPQRPLHLLEIPKLSFNVYSLKFKSMQSISGKCIEIRREKEKREEESRCGLIDRLILIRTNPW